MEIERRWVLTRTILLIACLVLIFDAMMAYGFGSVLAILMIVVSWLPIGLICAQTGVGISELINDRLLSKTTMEEKMYFYRRKYNEINDECKKVKETNGLLFSILLQEVVPLEIRRLERLQT